MVDGAGLKRDDNPDRQLHKSLEYTPPSSGP